MSRASEIICYGGQPFLIAGFDIKDLNARNGNLHGTVGVVEPEYGSIISDFRIFIDAMQSLGDGRESASLLYQKNQHSQCQASWVVYWALPD